MSRTCLAGSRARVHWLLGGAQGHALLLQLMHDILQVFHGPGQPVDARHHQGVAGLHEVEQHLQLGSVLTRA